MFHAGIALIVAGAFAWFVRQGPAGEPGVAPAPAAIRSTQVIAGEERKSPVSSVKAEPTRVRPAVVKRTAVKPGKVKKVKANTVKRRSKKAKKRSTYVQR